MIDLFISFSTRSVNDQDQKELYKQWVSTFRQKLMDSYRNNYGKDLEVWDDIQKNGPGKNFITEIDKALQQTSILVTILDMAYLDSSQALDEVDKYQRIRNESEEPIYILKVVKRCGIKKDEIRDFIDSSIILSSFSRQMNNGLETEYLPDSDEYNREINKLVLEIRKLVIEQNRWKNCKSILHRIKELKDQPLIYVALGHGTLRDDRIKFINQLAETLKRNSKLSQIKIFPDDLTLSLMDHESLGELLFEENPYREKCLSSMLDACAASLVPIEYNSNNEADEIKQNIRYQLDIIKSRAQNDNKQTVYILLNFPEKLKASSPFNEVINNPVYVSYENIKIRNDQNIATFINLFVKELEAMVVPAEVSCTMPCEKLIYLIEYDKPIDPSNHPERDLLAEQENRNALRKEIADKFTLIPSFQVRDNLTDAIEQHKEWLKICDGIIIYRGIVEDEQWCVQKQADTYKALLQLAEKRKLNRAVYVDPLQKKREAAGYSFFKYEVIVNDPPELNSFLCKI